jgi:hypothetical protein
VPQIAGNTPPLGVRFARVVPQELDPPRQVDAQPAQAAELVRRIGPDDLRQRQGFFLTVRRLYQQLVLVVGLVQFDNLGTHARKFLLQFGVLLLKTLFRRLPGCRLLAVLQLHLPQGQPLVLQAAIDLADLLDLQPPPLVPSRPHFRMISLELLPNPGRFGRHGLTVHQQCFGEPIKTAPGQPLEHHRPGRLLLGGHLELADPGEMLVGQFKVPGSKQAAMHRHGHFVGKQ